MSAFRKQSFKPILEALEDRCLLSATPLTVPSAEAAIARIFQDVQQQLTAFQATVGDVILASQAISGATPDQSIPAATDEMPFGAGLGLTLNYPNSITPYLTRVPNTNLDQRYLLGVVNFGIIDPNKIQVWYQFIEAPLGKPIKPLTPQIGGATRTASDPIILVPPPNGSNQWLILASNKIFPQPAGRYILTVQVGLGPQNPNSFKPLPGSFAQSEVIIIGTSSVAEDVENMLTAFQETVADLLTFQADLLLTSLAAQAAQATG